MPFYGGSGADAFGQGLMRGQDMQTKQAQLAQMLQAMSQQKMAFDQQQQAQQRALAARQGAGQALFDQFAQPPAPGASSPPGTPNGGQPPPGGSAPGGGMMPPAPPPGPGAQAMQMGGAPGAPIGQPPAAPPQPPMNPSWQPMPTQPQGGGAPPPGAGAGMISPPAAEKPAAAGAGVAEPKPFDLKGMVQSWAKQGVPPGEVMDRLDALMPLMNSQNKAELQSFKLQNEALNAGLKAAAAVMQAQAATKRADTGQEEHARKVEADASKKELNDARKKKLERGLSGTGGAGAVKIVKWKEDADGNTVGGFDRAGHFHPIDEAAPKTSPKAAANKTREVAGLREDRRSLIMRGLSPTDPKIVALDAQITAAEKTGSKPAAGGGGDMQAKVSAAWGAYEPEKYDYRINDQGVVQRKPKGQ